MFSLNAFTGKTFETRDPRTGDVLAHVAEADKADVDLAVKSARDAFEHGKWPRMSGYVSPIWPFAMQVTVPCLTMQNLVVLETN